MTQRPSCNFKLQMQHLSFEQFSLFKILCYYLLPCVLEEQEEGSHLDPSKKAAIWNLTVTNFLAMAVSLTFRQP